ncbi:unnamed protein product [Rotaria sordida]|uniref:Uncharacterized protein n=1 Tax=Rotaria sordida TaxID=392033 RepID=A0A820A0A5_9BILA|nr:unnamed protein product [Rotaria sordida]CAF4178382.1 unnamed protein product [Rotaria sordida]
MYSDYKLLSSLLSNKHTYIDKVVNLSCVCHTMNCCGCCKTNKRNQYTSDNIQEQFDRLTYLSSLNKNQIPHAKICLDKHQFTCPSPALRYTKVLRRKLCSVPEPILFGLPIQYDNHSIDRKNFSIEKLCEWPFTGISEYLRSYRSYTVDEIQSHRSKKSFKEHQFLIKDLEPMTLFTTYSVHCCYLFVI